jgi:hypothetical protein
LERTVHPIANAESRLGAKVVNPDKQVIGKAPRNLKGALRQAPLYLRLEIALEPLPVLATREINRYSWAACFVGFVAR